MRATVVLSVGSSRLRGAKEQTEPVLVGGKPEHRPVLPGRRRPLCRLRQLAVNLLDRPLTTLCLFGDDEWVVDGRWAVRAR